MSLDFTTQEAGISSRQAASKPDRVLLVWDADYPWDVRVEKVGLALDSAGYEVHILARNRRRDPVEEQVGPFFVHRLHPLPSWLGRLNNTWTFPAFVNPVWYRRLTAVINEVHPSVVICRDLPLAPLTIRAGHGRGIPVVMDMAEAYPDMIRNVWLFGPRRARNLLIRNPLLADMVERWTVRRLDKILVVVEESTHRLQRLGVPASRIVLVSNTPVPSRFEVQRRDSATGRLSLLYIGLLGRSRGMEVALRGLAEYIRRGKEATLTIGGTGVAEASLKRLTRRLGLTQRVRFLGWVPPAAHPGLLADASVGLVPHRRCPHWDVTIPNKLFDYMAAGLPVLVSDPPPIKRIVEETGSGLVYQDPDPNSFATVLEAMEDPGTRLEMAARGRSAVQERYNWEVDSRALLAAVAELIGHRRPAASTEPLSVDALINNGIGPAFSVVVPVKNKIGFLKPFLDSLDAAVEALPTGSVEVVLVDNQSTDGAREFLRARYPTGVMHLISNASTVAAVRNLGAAASHGETLVFLDSDCLIPEGFLAQVHAVLQDSSAAAVGHKVRYVEPSWVERAWNNVHFISEEGPTRWLPGACFAVRRTAFEATGGFRAELASGEDVDLAARLTAGGHLVWSSPQLIITHLDNPRTLRAFFAKEVWRGLGARQTSNGIAGNRVLMMAIGYLVSVAGAPMIAVWPGIPLVSRLAIVVALILGVPLVTVIYRVSRLEPGRRGAAIWGLAPGTLLYAVYYLARATALAAGPRKAAP